MEFLPIGIPEIDNFDHLNTVESFAMICWMEKRSNLEFLQKTQIPFINLRECDIRSNLDLSVSFSGEGQVAADFFIDQMGFDNLIFLGKEGIPSHRRRYLEFKRGAELRHAKLRAEFYPSRFQDGGESGTFDFDNDSVRRRNADLSKILLESPKPTGILCADDRIALNLYFRAIHLGVSVPEEVAILGIGSSQYAERGGVQSISVIQMDHIRQGYQAAQLIDLALSRRPHESHITLEPDGIIHRNTTTRRTIRDPLVRQAMEIIDRDRRISVEELGSQLGVTTRTLRSHFLSATNMSVSKAIDLERFNHAKQLLRSRRYNHQAIASLSGYRNHKQMLRSFERFVGMSPTRFSEQYLRPERS